MKADESTEKQADKSEEPETSRRKESKQETKSDGSTLEVEDLNSVVEEMNTQVHTSMKDINLRLDI